MSKILTIVVPSYNVQEYLAKNINSMIDERILSDIEIIIVDDGSGDQTGVIADGFEEQYPDTVRVIHKENGGHGSTINAAIAVAKGKYFCVLDADDWMVKENFVKMVHTLKKIDIDILLFNFNKVNPDGEVLKKIKITGLPENIPFLIEDYIKKIPNRMNTNLICIHGYCVKTSILVDNQVHLHEHHYYVDQEFILYSLCYVKTAAFLDLTVRNWRFGYNEQSSSYKSKQKNYKQYEEVVKYLVDFCNSHDLRTNMKWYYCRHIAWFLTGAVSTYLSFGNDDKKKELVAFDRWLKEHADPLIYKLNKNIALSALRITDFRLYNLGAFLYRIIFMR